MSPEGPTPPEEQGAAWLAAYDQALAAGRPPLSGDAPPDLRTRLERGARQRKTSRAIVRWPDSGFRSPVPNLAVDWPHVLRTPAAAPAPPPGDLPSFPTSVERSHDLAALSHRDAHRLDGRRVRIRVDLDSLPGDAGGAVVYNCVSWDAVNRTVWLIPGQQAKDVIVVEGVFRLLWRAPGNGFQGY